MSFSRAFWQEFTGKIWERRPLILRRGKAPLQEIDAELMFELLVRYSDRCRRRRSTEGLKFYLNTQLQYEIDTLQFLPRRSDRSLLGYHTRMSADFDDYCLVCDGLMKLRFPESQRIRKFMHEIARRVSTPVRFSEVGFYMGNYRKTPFGVHVDACGVFSFPVVGKKVFRLWKPSYVASHPSLDRAFKYTRHLKSSRVLRPGVGDMTYWPSTAWHIAESTGEFSATWSIGVWLKPQS